MSPEFASNNIDIDGLNISYEYRDGTGHPLLFFHATGFNKAVWYQVVKDIENPVYLVDALGHGQSDHPQGDFYWDQTAKFLANFTDTLTLTNIIGVGHSMGGQLMLSIAAQRPDLFEQLILLDPVVLPIEQIKFLQSMTNSPISRRRNDWSSSQELFDTFTEKPPFSRWNKNVLKDYAKQALTPNVDTDRFTLACDPKLEACVYRNLGAESLLTKLEDIHTPTHIIRARARTQEDQAMSFDSSPTWPELVNKLPNATDEQIAGWSHFFPMEHPEWLSEKIQQFT